MVAEATSKVTPTSLPYPTKSSNVINIADRRQPDKTDADDMSAKETTDIQTNTESLSSVAKEQKQDKANEMTADDMEELVEHLNDVTQLFNKHYSFSVNDDIHPSQYIIKIMDQNSGDVIKQIPPEEALELASNIDKMVGVFVDQFV